MREIAVVLACCVLVPAVAFFFAWVAGLRLP